MLDLIVRGGQVVTPDVVATLDIGIEGGRIALLAQPGTLGDDAGRVIDAGGLIVLPGGIEPHAHIGQRVPVNWAGRRDVYTQSPEAASRAAAFGGVTTIVDFAAARRREGEGAPVPAIEQDIEARGWSSPAVATPTSLSTTSSRARSRRRRWSRSRGRCGPGSPASRCS